jgi:hypothetical protein
VGGIEINYVGIALRLCFRLFQEIYKDRKKFSKQVFEVASSDLVNMGITVVSYTLKDIRDEEVSAPTPKRWKLTVFCSLFARLGRSKILMP